jgi:dimethylaniline monooxygenase (N-oxide forming)
VERLDGDKAALPPPDEARRGISRHHQRSDRRYLASKRHTIEVDFLAHLKEIERERRAGARRARSVGK